jgi:hypothetical protein
MFPLVSINKDNYAAIKHTNRILLLINMNLNDNTNISLEALEIWKLCPRFELRPMAGQSAYYLRCILINTVK